MSSVYVTSVNSFLTAVCPGYQEDPSGGVSCLTDGDTETYWESDGMQGQHWIRLQMKRGTVVKSVPVRQHSVGDRRWFPYA